MRNNEAARVAARSVVDVNSEVSHFTCEEEVLGHGDLHVGFLAAHEADLLLEWHNDVELGVVDNWADRADVDPLAIAYFALTPLVIEQVSAHWDELGFEEVAQLAAELGPPLGEVEGLWQVDAIWNVELERDLAAAGWTDVPIERNELVLFPCAPFPDVWISLALVAVVDFLATVDQLKFQLDAIGWNGLVGLDADHARDRVVRVKGARVALETNLK